MVSENGALRQVDNSPVVVRMDINWWFFDLSRHVLSRTASVFNMLNAGTDNSKSLSRNRNNAPHHDFEGERPAAARSYVHAAGEVATSLRQWPVRRSIALMSASSVRPGTDDHDFIASGFGAA